MSEADAGSGSRIRAILTRQNLRRLGVGLAAIAVAAFAYQFIWNAPQPDRNVVAEWNDVILRLGIEPVFPPEEDIYVGDIFAVITVDRRPASKNTRQQALLNRAIKLAHIDMSADLVKFYETLPRFPDTEKRPASPEDPWLLKEKVDSVFLGVPNRGSLAIAAFPGFTIRHERGVSGGLSSALAGVFGGALQESDIVEVKIPTAETYGVPSVLATARLALFCQDPFTAGICSDDTLRYHLGYVTPDMRATAIDPDTGRLRYLVDVEIALVNRVYLTRSIEQTRTLGRSQAAAIKAVTDAAGRIKGAALPKSGDGVKDDDASSAQKQAKELLGQLDRSVPGGLASIYSGSDSSFELKQTFQRPIVIGYRAVRRSFDYNLDQQNLTPDQREANGGASK